MYDGLFSKKYKLRPTTEGLIADSIPDTARIGLTNLIHQYFSINTYPFYTTLYEQLCLLFRVEINLDCAGNQFAAYSAMKNMIKTCQWWYFYDICQIAYDILRRHDSERSYEFALSLSILFTEENLGYQFTQGKIDKIHPEIIQITINEVRVLLKEPEFKGADYLFEKAIKALNIRPKPDAENCVKDAVAAIESVGRAIINDKNALLDDIIRSLTKKGIIPKPLNLVIDKLYAYRGNEPGVSHGAVEIPKVTVDEAEFILAVSAAAIIYLVKKREQIV
jgi:hypothetical protein